MNTLLPVAATGYHVYLWQLLTGFGVYWIICALISDKMVRKDRFLFIFPSIRVCTALLAWFILPGMLLYSLVTAISVRVSGKQQNDSQDDSGPVLACIFGVFYLMLQVSFMFIPPTQYHDDTKLVGPHGLTCYAEMTGEHKDIIRHYECKTVSQN